MRKSNVIDRRTDSDDEDVDVVIPPTQRVSTPTDPPAASGPGGGGGLTRVTVNLNRQAMQALDQVSAATGYTKTDTINRALQIYAIVQQIMERDEGTIRVMHLDGEVERIHII
jgi:hypothetical protein